MNRKVKQACMWLMVLTMILSVSAAPVYAESGAEAVSPLQAQIEKRLSDLKKDDNSIGLHAGIAVYDLTDKRFLYQHQARRSYIPASTLKLFTTITGLDRLGPDYRWKTEVLIDGSLVGNGVVQGNLILKGYGDPSLKQSDLRDIALALKEKGIRRVTGKLLVDESYFDTQRLGMGWMWDDEPYGYSAQLSGLAAEKNSVTVSITPGKASSPAVTLQPATTYLAITNQIQTVPNSSSTFITVERPRGKNEIILKGTIGAQAKPYQEAVTMEDPALYVGELWRDILLQEGIITPAQKGIEKTVATHGTALHTHYSKPLSELVIELNKESDNFYADMLMKTLGATQKGEGSSAAGSAEVRDMLKHAGIESGFRVVDGSGLSRFNWITPEQMVTMLAFVQEQSYRDALEASLPIAGVDGTLKNRLKGTIAEKKAIAKTGSMGGVNTLAGYVTAQNGHKLAYSIMTNGVYKSKYARDLQDQIVVLLTSYPQLSMPDGYATDGQKTYKLSATLDPILDQPQLENLAVGLLVKSLESTGDEAIWYERDADTLLTPAANVKMLTSAAALSQLGPEYVYKTELYTDAAKTDSPVIQGNLYVKGYGDPTIHTDDALKVQNGVSVEQIVDVLKEQGIRQITGNLILDETYFDHERLGLGWTWDDEDEAFNPRIGALSLNRGTIALAYKPGDQEGDAVRISLYPNTSYLSVKNEAVTVEGGKDSLIIERDRGTNQIRVTGTLPLDHDGGAKRIPVENPAMYFGTVLKEKMEEEGIRFSGNSQIVLGAVPATAVKQTEFTSLPLRQIVDYMSKQSDNGYAEMILKSIGAYKQANGSADSGIRSVLEMVQAMGGKTNFDMMDGSGLTRYNLISPRHFVSVLEGMSKQHEISPVFEEVLSLAGVDGTLEERFVGTAAEENLTGVTGSMTDVRSLSGYVTTERGEKLVFSLIINGYMSNDLDLNSIEEQIVSNLASHD